MSGVRSEVNNKIGATRRTVLYRYRSPRCLFTFTGTLVPCESRLPPDPPVSFYRYACHVLCPNLFIDHAEIQRFKDGWSWWQPHTRPHLCIGSENAECGAALAFGCQSTQDGGGVP